MDMKEFKETPIVKKMKKSMSSECLEETALKIMEATQTEPRASRGRKAKYATNEERLAARKQQQRDYRERKKRELQELKEKVKKFEENQNVVE